MGETYIEMCPRCNDRLSAPQVCPRCRKYHWHGCVHTYDDHLWRLCDACLVLEVEHRQLQESRCRGRTNA